MSLLWLLSWSYARKHRIRTMLTVGGIAIGVSVFQAMHSANRAVFDSFRDTINRIAGAAELQVSAGEVGFDEAVVERIQSLGQVKAAAPVIEAVVGTGLPGQGNLLILGVDLTGDRRLREYDLESAGDAVIEDPLVFLALPDSLMISSEFARRNNLALDSLIPLETAVGRREFRVRGILRSGGLNAAFGGNIAVMDIYAAQHVFGRGRRFDRIDLAVSEGVKLEDAQAALHTALGPGFQVQAPAARGQGFQSVLRVYSFMLNFSSLFALVVGMFITYNSFSTAVAQRRQEIGILRALGATRAQVAALFLSESVLAGLVGSGLGVLLGHAGAGAIASILARFLEDIYGAARAPGSVDFSPGLVAAAVALGTAVTVIGALVPACSAARVPPIVALQKGRYLTVTERQSRARAAAAVFLGSGGLASLAFTRSLAAFYAGYLCLLAAVVLVTPQLALRLARLLRPFLAWLRPIEGALAADSLIGAPRRTSATVAALMLSLALVIGLGGTARANYTSVTEWLNEALDPDLFVTSSPALTTRSYRFPASMTAELQSIAGIHEVQPYRCARIDYQGELVLIFATPLERYAARARRRAVEGDLTQMFRLAAAGRGVIASENFASRRGLHVGDTVDVPAPSGPLRLPLVGIVRDYSDLQGALILDHELFRRNWNDDSVDFFGVYLTGGLTDAVARGSILSRLGANRRVFVLTNAEVRRYVLRLSDQWFGMTWVQICVAIGVAVLGIGTSLTVSIVDRRRELGVLRAVGGLRSQIRGTIWLESAGIALLGLVLGLAFGAIHLYFMLELHARDFPGMRFDYTYPFGVALLLLPVTLAAALLSALGPAEAAVRGSLVEALEYE